MKCFLKRTLLVFCGLGVLGILFGAFLLVGQATKPDPTEAELQAAFQSGKLVLVAFHSQNCKYCKADKPVLEDLAPRLFDILVIVRVDVGTKYGKQLAQQVGVRGVPSYFLVDPVSGDTVYTQQGSLQVQRMAEAIQAWFQQKEGGE